MLTQIVKFFIRSLNRLQAVIKSSTGHKPDRTKIFTGDKKNRDTKLQRGHQSWRALHLRRSTVTRIQEAHS